MSQQYFFFVCPLCPATGGVGPTRHEDREPAFCPFCGARLFGPKHPPRGIDWRSYTAMRTSTAGQLLVELWRKVWRRG